ncbi:MAG: O-antigen ligase family protein, partial [Acidimicrobiales bacterium]
MAEPRAALSVLAVGIASGLGTVDLVGIAPDLPAEVLPLVITAVAAIGAALSPPAVLAPGRSRLILGLFGSWLGWSYLSALTSEDPALAMATTASFVAVMLGAMGVVAHRSRTSLIVVMGVAALVQAVAALVAAFTVEFDQFPTRLSLVHLEANQLGRFLALSILLTVLWIIEHPARRWSPAVVFVAVTTLGLLLTGSRTAPTALVVAGFIALLAARRWRLLVVGVVAGTVVVSGLLASGFDARIVELTNRSGTELSNLNGGNGRTTLWPEVLNVIDDHPVTGIGLGVDRERMRQINAETAISWDPQHVHNLVLHLAFTTGWVGAALFLSAM